MEIRVDFGLDAWSLRGCQSTTSLLRTRARRRGGQLPGGGRGFRNLEGGFVGQASPGCVSTRSLPSDPPGCLLHPEPASPEKGKWFPSASSSVRRSGTPQPRPPFRFLLLRVALRYLAVGSWDPGLGTVFSRARSLPSRHRSRVDRLAPASGDARGDARRHRDALGDTRGLRGRGSVPPCPLAGRPDAFELGAEDLLPLPRVSRVLETWVRSPSGSHRLREGRRGRRWGGVRKPGIRTASATVSPPRASCRQARPSPPQPAADHRDRPPARAHTSRKREDGHRMDTHVYTRRLTYGEASTEAACAHLLCPYAHITQCCSEDTSVSICEEEEADLSRKKQEDGDLEHSSGGPKVLQLSSIHELANLPFALIYTSASLHFMQPNKTKDKTNKIKQFPNPASPSIAF
nr:uncharacterized protein LOC106027225 [Cavia porcellus]